MRVYPVFLEFVCVDVFENDSPYDGVIIVSESSEGCEHSFCFYCYSYCGCGCFFFHVYHKVTCDILYINVAMVIFVNFVSFMLGFIFVFGVPSLAV